MRKSVYAFFNKARTHTRTILPRLSTPFLEAVAEGGAPSAPASSRPSSVSEAASSSMNAMNPIRRPSLLDGKGGVQSSAANHAVCASGFFFVAFILAIVGLAANMNWIEGTLGTTVVQITTSGSITTETITYGTTTVVGTLSTMSSSTCSVRTTSNNGPVPSPLPVPIPSTRPSVSCSGSSPGLSGNFFSSYSSQMCASPAMEGDLICAALRAMWQGAGWIITLEIGLLLLSALGFVSAYGLAKRLTAAIAADADPAAKNPRGPGRWAWLCGLRFDQAFTVFFIALLDAILAVMFVVSWPSVIATAFNNINAYLKSQLPPTLPSGFSYTFSSNPAPGAGYYIVFAGCLCIGVAFLYSFVLYGASFCGKVGCCSVPPSSNGATAPSVAVASPLHNAGAVGAPAGVVSVGGGAYLPVATATPSKDGDGRASYAPAEAAKI